MCLWFPTPVRLGSPVSLCLGPPQAHLNCFFTPPGQQVATLFSKKVDRSWREGTPAGPQSAQTRLCEPQIVDSWRGDRHMNVLLAFVPQRPQVTDVRLVLQSPSISPIALVALRPRWSRIFWKKGAVPHFCVNISAATDANAAAKSAPRLNGCVRLPCVFLKLPRRSSALTALSYAWNGLVLGDAD